MNAKMTFEDNSLVQQLFGFHHRNLARIEQEMNVVINVRGNEIIIVGATNAVETTERVFTILYSRLKEGKEVGADAVEAVLNMATAPNGDIRDVSLIIKTHKRQISPRTPAQAGYLRMIDKSNLVFGEGPAGTGKTYLAVAKAAEQLINGKVDRIILSRPAVEAGEQLGFLPGDMRDKVDPYLRPLFDALHDMMPASKLAKCMERGDIEVAPLAFMRGRTLTNACVILDEAQNTTAVQMKMFLTRLGENSSMVITGDLSQVDLPNGVGSGLRDAIEILAGVRGASFVRFTSADIVRHPIVSRIVCAYEEAEIYRKSGTRHGSLYNNVKDTQPVGEAALEG